MPEQTNSSKRLYDILDGVISYGDEEGYVYSPTPPTRQTSRGMKEIWLEAMGIDEDEDDEADEKFHDSLCDVLLLIKSCEQIVRQSDTMNQELHFGVDPTVRTTKRPS